MRRVRPRRRRPWPWSRSARPGRRTGRRRGTGRSRRTLRPQRGPGQVRGAPLGRGAPRRHPARLPATRPCMPATCTTCRPPCGTPGRPTTRSPTASSWREAQRGRSRGRAATEAISYAAYRILSDRYGKAVGAKESLAEFDATHGLALLPDATGRCTDGDSPTALGNRIAATVIAAGLHDGSREQKGYAPKDYKPVNKPLIVELPGTRMKDPNRWQPLALEVSVAQNGILLPVGPAAVRGTSLGPRHVLRAARPRRRACPSTRAPPPRCAIRRRDADFKAGRHRRHPPEQPARPDDDGQSWTSRPAHLGNNPLGTNDGTGTSVNPVTGEPYAPDVVLRGDFARALTEFWADGPSSETPPGPLEHHRQLRRRQPGLRAAHRAARASALDPLEWDVKMYLALNGAVHDAAVAAWGAKGYYDTVRPISMIRYMGGLGQSSDPSGPSYDPDGLPLVSRPRRGHHGRVAPRPGSATRTSPTTSARSPSGPGTGNPEDPETELRRRGLDPRRRVGALPAAHVRDARLRRLRLGPLARSAARRPRCSRPSPARAYFPGGLSDLDDPGRATSTSRRARARTSSCSGRPTTTRPTRPALAALRRHPHRRGRLRGVASWAPQCGKDAWAAGQPLLGRHRPRLSRRADRTRWPARRRRPHRPRPWGSLPA